MPPEDTEFLIEQHDARLRKACSWLFPDEDPETILACLRKANPAQDSWRVKWDALAMSHGDRARLEGLVSDAIRDYRDILAGGEAQSCQIPHPERHGQVVAGRRRPGLQGVDYDLLLPPLPKPFDRDLWNRELRKEPYRFLNLPAAFELEFEPLRTEIWHLGFFDRMVVGELYCYKTYGSPEPPPILGDLIEAFAARIAPVAKGAKWTERPWEEAKRFLLHVFSRSFTEAERGRAPELLAELMAVFREQPRAFLSESTRTLELGDDFRLQGPRAPYHAYDVGVSLVGKAFIGLVWMSHG